MSKNRFTNSDTRAMVRDIRSVLLGKRVANIYDLSDKCYLFKFAIAGNSKKIYLLLESGIRFHTTKYVRDLPDLPSPFAMKLRKYIRTKKLEDIQQIGNDRVVDFQFGSGDSMNHLIIELYNNGNIILTDANYEVIALLRTHQFAEDISINVGEVYPISFTTNTFNNITATTTTSSTNLQQALLTQEELVETITNDNDSNLDITGIKEFNVDKFLIWAYARLHEIQLYHEMNNNESHIIHQQNTSNTHNDNDEYNSSKLSITSPSTTTTISTTIKQGKKAKKIKEFMMRQLLLSKECFTSSYGPEILDHCLITAGIQPDFHVKLLNTLDNNIILKLLNVLNHNSKELYSLLVTPGQSGYIIMKNTEEYIEFLPTLYEQHKDRLSITCSSFDEAVDEYYCKIEEQKLNKEVNSIEIAAGKKLKKLKKDQEQLRKGLVNHQSKMQKSAMLLETYAEDVDKVCLVINSAIDSGMNWDDIADMVKVETLHGNPIASLISRLKLETNHIVLKLTDLYNDDEDINDNNDDTNSNISMKKQEEIQQNLLISKQKKRNDKKNQIDITKVIEINKNTMEIEIDLQLSAYANARNMYSQKKVATAKEIKAVGISEKVVENVENQIKRTLDKHKLKRNLLAIRKIHWFEKFNWCYSSEGYLILSGRDPQQSSILMNKYLRTTDIYVHADITDAYPCIVRMKSYPHHNDSSPSTIHKDNSESKDILDVDKQNLDNKSISPLAIQEAAMISLSRSSIWKGKIQGMAAWWVWGKQIIFNINNTITTSSSSSSSSSTTSNNISDINKNKVSYIISGKKHFLAPMPLEMGFGILFRIDESCISKHTKDWKDRNYLYDLETSSVFTENLDRYDVSFEDLDVCDRENKLDIVPEVSEDDIDLQEDIITDQMNKKLSLSSNNKDNYKDDVVKYEHSKDIINDSDDYDNIDEIDNHKEQSDDNSIESESHIITKPYKQSKEILQKSNKNIELTKNTSNKRNTKYINKKKARRYANQDEEDRELAMLGIGHASSKTGETLVDMKLKSIKDNKKKDLQQRQDKAGIKLLQKDNWNDLMNLLDISISKRLNDIIQTGLLKHNDIDNHEIKTLATYTIEQANDIMNLFCEGANLNKIGNKSGFLAGIMRRYSIDIKKKQLINENDLKNNHNHNNESKEIVDIEDEFKDEENLDNRTDDLEQFTGIPFADDIILYALPVCGSYASLQNYKYKVKLTPGSGKKGKSGKQAIDVFIHMKECNLVEKGFIQNISENEIVANMLGDVKLSMPGLYQKQSQMKNKNK